MSPDPVIFLFSDIVSNLKKDTPYLLRDNLETIEHITDNLETIEQSIEQKSHPSSSVSGWLLGILVSRWRSLFYTGPPTYGCLCRVHLDGVLRRVRGACCKLSLSILPRDTPLSHHGLACPQKITGLFSEGQTLLGGLVWLKCSLELLAAQAGLGSP